MDKNKFEKLRQISYVVKKTCGMCSMFRAEGAKEFGVCVRYDYAHLKHTGPRRGLSVSCRGFCENFEMNEIELGKLHGFAELLEK
jgi:hypothetical protein